MLKPISPAVPPVPCAADRCPVSRCLASCCRRANSAPVFRIPHSSSTGRVSVAGQIDVTPIEASYAAIVSKASGVPSHTSCPVAP